jgi:hypothetical protein
MFNKGRWTMSELSSEQVKFLHAYAHDQRTMDALLKHHGITPRMLRQWRQEPAFAAELKAVHQFHRFARNCNVLKAAVEHTRKKRSSKASPTPERGRTARLFAAAMKMDAAPGRRQGVQKLAANPVHPTFAEQAPHLLEQLEARLKNQK